MDDSRFDEIAQSLQYGATRRAAGQLLAGGALASLAGWLGLSEDGEAKRKRKKKKRKKTSTQRCPSSLPTQCPPTAQDPDGLCAPPGFHCCTSSQGGGACEGAYPQCCAPTAQDPQGLCIPNGSVCCTSSEGGGYCDPGETCCPPCAGWPNGFCAPLGYNCVLDCKSGLTATEGLRERQTKASPRSGSR
jgi:hypothetical protein